MSRLTKFLANSTGLSEADVRNIIMRAPISYKNYPIEKRRGGERIISQPAREVKALQRILSKQLSHLPIHQAATAYRAGISIKENAKRHASNGPIRKYDFKDFFHSIKARDWQSYCEIHEVFKEPVDIELSARLFFYRPRESHVLRLAIGAPSSPWISNVLMHDFDDQMAIAVSEDQVTYTRYADDLTFSAPRTGFLTGVDQALRKIVSAMAFPKLVINEEKSVVATMKFRRVVTGLVLANDGRVTLGRDRKRNIRAAVHHALLGRNNDEENERLAGLLSFARDVEPEFYVKLESKYGAALHLRLLKSSEGKV